jgi:hypothetical protein
MKVLIPPARHPKAGLSLTVTVICGSSESRPFLTDRQLDPTIELEVVLEKLLKVLGEDQPGEEVLLSLAFDEAQSICHRISENWAPFDSLRRALRAIVKHSVWAFFLSTTGTLSQFAPAHYLDSSARILMGTLSIAIPFSALGFDQLAEKFRDDGSMSLETVSSESFRFSLGRPM